jgi:hypothetical protein
MILITLLAVQQSRDAFGRHDHHQAVFFDDSLFSESRVVSQGSIASGPESTFGYISDLWRRSLILREWILDSQALNWERLHAPNPARADLAEARYHIGNAEVFEVAIGEGSRAGVELDRAVALLESRSLERRQTHELLDEVRHEVIAARHAPKSVTADEIAQYERIKIELDHLAALL